MIIHLQALKDKVLELGWQDVGVTHATVSEENIRAYRDWVAEGYHANLAYMENEMRCFPQQFFPEAKSAILCVSNYKQEPLPYRADAGLIASYARGRDYHHVHRKRLKRLIRWLEEQTGTTNIAKPFSDSAPVLEKALAVQAGLGWFGKNTLLIHRRFGTFIFLSGLFTSLSFAEAKVELRLPRCGVCTRCMDACPTQALRSPYTLDAGRCLSNHLIESKEPLPAEIVQKNPGYVFGCDICQQVCPHNWRTPVSETPEFQPEQGIGPYLTLEVLQQIEAHPEMLHGTPLQRRGAAGLRRNFDSLERPVV
jgi:epoxyqueuosine reductase